MRFLERIQRWYKTRKHLRKVGPLLIRRYGKSKSYSRGQIDRSVGDAGLEEKEAMTAYALYMDEEEFVAAFGEGSLQEYSMERSAVAELYFSGDMYYSAADVMGLAESSTSSGSDFAGNVASEGGDAGAE